MPIAPTCHWIRWQPTAPDKKALNQTHVSQSTKYENFILNYKIISNSNNSRPLQNTLVFKLIYQTFGKKSTLGGGQICYQAF